MCSRTLREVPAGPGAAVALGERVLAGLAALEDAQRTLLADLAAFDSAGGDPDTPTQAWLREHSKMGHVQAHRMVELARRLYGHSADLAATAAAMDTGTVTCAHAQVIADATRRLPEPIAADVATAMLAAAPELDVTWLRRVGRHAVACAKDMADEPVRGYLRDEERYLDASTTFDGMVDIRGLLTPACGEALLAALAALTGPPADDDERSPGQRRHDAFEDLLRGETRPDVTISVGLDVLTTGTGAGQTGSGAPIDAVTAAAAACDARITRIVTSRTVGSPGAADLIERVRAALPPALGGPAAEILDLGRTHRLVSPALRRALAARDRGCAYPGCGRPPAHCDAHHVQAWIDGGRTDLDNLVLLCRRHHRRLHERQQTLVRDADGRWQLTRQHDPPMTSDAA